MTTLAQHPRSAPKGHGGGNRLTSADGVPYTWDSNGNMLSDGVNTYTYDSANRLIGVSGQSSVSSYQYNGLGDRLSQDYYNNMRTYTLDLAGGLTQVLNEGNDTQITDTYIYGQGRIADDYGYTEYYLADALGSVRQVIDEEGLITLTRTYAPYGEVIDHTGYGYSNFGFTGEMTDDNTGLVYLRARYYSPYQGRFMTRDVWEGDSQQPMSYNTWLYGYANPILYTDPSGKITSSEDAEAKRKVQELMAYWIYIKPDWGPALVPVPTPPEPAPASTPTPGAAPTAAPASGSECGWRDGNWRSLNELEFTKQAVEHMARTLGGEQGFRDAMKYMVTIHRVPTELIFGYGAFSINNVILPNNVFSSSDDWDRGQVVHELAHVWDTRQWPMFQLSNKMASLTKSFKVVCEQVPTRGVHPCHYVYDPTTTGEEAPTERAQAGPSEDWADSFKVELYPALAERPLGPIRTAYILSVISNAGATQSVP